MNQPRRILHVISRLDGYGGARPLRDLAAAQAARGDQVTVAALSVAEESVLELRGAGVAVSQLGGRWPIDLVAMARLSRLRRRLSANIVHAWDVAALMYAAFDRPRGVGETLLATIGSAEIGHQWTALAIRKAHRRVAVFVANDEQTFAWLRRQGVDGDRIRVIRPGVATPASPALSRAELLAQLSLPTDAQLIATAGPLRRQKRIDEAIWCFELVRVLHDRVRLVVFGDGPDRHRLERFALQVSEPGCVHFAGFRSDLAHWLAHADVFWQLDAAHATPLALLEALAAGAPAVASDVPAHRAVIAPDQNGSLTPLDSRAEVARATDELLNDPQRARRFAAAAAEIVAKNWSLDAMNSAYHELYDQAR